MLDRGVVMGGMDVMDFALESVGSLTGKIKKQSNLKQLNLMKYLKAEGISS